jgi:hypothetical protein
MLDLLNKPNFCHLVTPLQNLGILTPKLSHFARVYSLCIVLYSSLGRAKVLALDFWFRSCSQKSTLRGYG